jgi:hypothetical protein
MKLLSPATVDTVVSKLDQHGVHVATVDDALDVIAVVLAFLEGQAASPHRQCQCCKPLAKIGLSVIGVFNNVM